MQELAADIESKVAVVDPRIELILVEQAGPEALRIYIDHPDGVDLALCESVNKGLVELSATWGLEVSSPGVDRPLTKPSHYRRFLGSQVRVRTREAVAGSKSFRGRLVAADEQSLSVETDTGTREIPLALVHRSNLVPEYAEVSQ